MVITVDFLDEIALDEDVLVALDLLALIAFDDQVAIAADPFATSLGAPDSTR